MTHTPSAPPDAASPPTVDLIRYAGGSFYWLEARPAAGGEAAVVRSELRGRTIDITPAGVDVASDLHSYGGGAYAITDNAATWFTTADKPGLHRQDRRQTAVIADGTFGDLTAAGDAVLAVSETPDGDAIVRVGTDGEVVELVRAEAFLSSPQQHGDRIAWLQWGPEHMPWDQCQLRVARIAGDGRFSEPVVVAGGADEAATQPLWAPDGTLYFASDRSGWWNLYRWTGNSTDRVSEADADHAVAQWEHGYRTFDLLPGGGIAAITQRGSCQRLQLIHPSRPPEELPLPFTAIKPYLAVGGQHVGVIAATATGSPQPVAIDIHTGAVKPLNSVQGAASDHHHGVRSESVVVRGLAATIYTRRAGSEPGPVILRAHPGPTYNMQPRLDPHIRHFTSHGYTVVDVDYRGSTGYGRSFRQSLYGHWGTYDVEDCHTIARWLLATRRAQLGALFITGASAGGYTALRAISRPDSPFTAAVATSAIADPQDWTSTVPRFQRAHARQLAINAPPVRADALARPVLFLHGTRDAIAPIDQIRALAIGLRSRGADADMVELAAGHSLTAADVLARALAAEMSFYRRLSRHG